VLDVSLSLLQAHSVRRWHLLDLLKPPSLAPQPYPSSSSSGGSGSGSGASMPQQQQHCIPRATNNALPGIWSDLLSSHPSDPAVHCQQQQQPHHKQQQQQHNWRWALPEGTSVAPLFSLYETPPWCITGTARPHSGEGLLLKQLTVNLAESLKLRGHSSNRLVVVVVAAVVWQLVVVVGCSVTPDCTGRCCD
jgi:hypothetical protein